MIHKYTANEFIKKGQLVTTDMLHHCRWKKGELCQPDICDEEPSCIYHKNNNNENERVTMSVKHYRYECYMFVNEESCDVSGCFDSSCLRKKDYVQDKIALQAFSDKLNKMGKKLLNAKHKVDPKEQVDADFKYHFGLMQKIVYKNAVNKGFWETDRDTAVSLCLIHGEVSEAMEAVRDGIPPDKHLPNRDSFIVELADIVIRTMDLAAHNNLDLASVILEKIAFNETRPRKHGKKF